jgi:hypothetical protein
LPILAYPINRDYYIPEIGSFLAFDKLFKREKGKGRANSCNCPETHASGSEEVE